jgi:hypothetical protein
MLCLTLFTAVGFYAFTFNKQRERSFLLSLVYLTLSAASIVTDFYW